MYTTSYFGDDFPYNYNGWGVVDPIIQYIELLSDGNLIIL